VKDLSTLGVVALHSCISVELSIMISLSDRPRACYSWRVTWLGGCTVVSSLWKCVKRPGLLLCGSCEVDLELAIS
jgi:hypothetical protein